MKKSNSKQNESMMINADPSEKVILSGKIQLLEIENHHRTPLDIRQTIEHLQDDILQLKSNANKLSFEEQRSLKLATENLIQTIMSNKIEIKSNSSGEQVSSPSLFNDDRQQSELIPNDDIDHSIETHIHHPKCVTAQPSFAINSIMPRVPTRSIVKAIDEEDERSYDNYIITSEHLITTNEQFEDILKMNEQNSEKILVLEDSIVCNTDYPNWAYYSSKPDLFSTTLHSNLPIAHSEEQHPPLKQTFLSHFHRRTKFTSENNPATFHSSSLNASDYIKSFESNLISEQQHQLAQIILNDKSSLKHVKQGIFRVRKSRIIISFDDVQRKIDARGEDFLSSEVNQLQTKMTDSSIVSLFQSFESTIQKGELLIYNEKSIYSNHSRNKKSWSDISNGLYSVKNQLIRT